MVSPGTGVHTVANWVRTRRTAATTQIRLAVSVLGTMPLMQASTCRTKTAKIRVTMRNHNFPVPNLMTAAQNLTWNEVQINSVPTHYLGNDLGIETKF